MGDRDDHSSKSNQTRDAFQQAAGDVLAQRIKSIALEVRSISSPEAGAFASNETLSVLAMTLQRILKRLDEIFELEGFIFSPASHIMLELYQAKARGGLLSVSALCQVLTCPASVARRWIDALESMRLLEKLGDGVDGPRVVLTDRGYLKTSQALQLLL